MKYFSMFTGVGGFELGIGDKGQCVGFSEIDKYASQLLRTKWPTVPNFGDCKTIIPEQLPDFEMLFGGFPCQSFSIAGKRRGFQDTRGTMFFEICRILKVKRPKYCLLENVKGLLNHEKGKTFSVIIQTLEELGYRVEWMVLNSKFFGVPQNRERVFIIGSLRGEPRAEILPFRGNSTEIIESGKSQNAGTPCSQYARNPTDGSYISVAIPGSQAMRVYNPELAPTLKGLGGGAGAKTGLYAIPVLTPDRVEKRQNGRRFKEDGDESFTLTKTDIHGVMIQSHSPRTNDPKKGGSGPLISDEHSFTIDRTPHNVINGMKIRRLTPLECERLQSFPDNWTQGFSDTQRYKMMGNAVTVNVVKAIVERLYGNTVESHS